MSKNAKLVEYFLSEPFRNNKEGLRDVIAPNFVFKSARAGTMNFEKYCEYARTFYTEETVSLDWIQSVDDTNFGIAYTANDDGKTIFGNLAVSVYGGKIVALIE